jgi:hypothetical protein
MGNTIDLLKQLIESYFGEVRKTGETSLPVNYEIRDLVITSNQIVANVVMTGAQLTELLGVSRNENRSHQ